MTQKRERTPRPSEEASGEQLRLAKEQGDALQKAIENMTREEAHDGGERQAGDYLIGYAVEEAEGLYHLRDGRLEWEEPEEENLHVEVAVRDAADRRFIPSLEVYVTLIDADGREVGTHRQSYLWHPWLYHYGRNWMVPGDGEYTLKVRVEAPNFPRHDKENGRRFAEPVEVEFKDVEIKTGQKKS